MKDRNLSLMGGKEFVNNLNSALLPSTNQAEEKELTPEEKLKLEEKALGPRNFNRKMRRNQLRSVGVLKQKNRLRFGSKEWEAYYEKTRTEGKRIFEENYESVTKQMEWYLEQKDTNRRKHFKELGYTESEINTLQENWYDTVIKS